MKTLGDIAVPVGSWQSYAACAGLDIEDWFARYEQAASARDVCARCPVTAECLLDALRVERTAGTERPTGIRGGLSARTRRSFPPLPTETADALELVRQFIAEHEPQPTERITMTTAATTPPATPPTLAAVPEPEQRRPSENLPLGQLLKWADDQPDEDVRDQSARARAILAGLRSRYDTAKELAGITSEAEQLERRLAELRAREAELVPAKTKKKRTAPARDYDTREVRAWADANGVDCPRTGQLPKRVLDAWRTATSTAAP